MPTSDELMRLERACANRITLPRKSRQFPSFSEVEEQCEEEYEELLVVLHDDEVYRSADLAVQEQQLSFDCPQPGIYRRVVV